MHIDVLDFGLAFSIFYENNTCFIIFVQNASTNQLYNLKSVQKHLDLHAILYAMTKIYLFGFGGKN